MRQLRTRNRPSTPDAPARDPQAAETPPLDVAQLLAELSLWEKCALLAGRDGNWTVPIPRLGLEPVGMTDGPHGVCAWADCNSFEDRPAATTFPCGAALASTWNTDLMREVGRVLGHETRALGYEVLLGPCINIVRSPLGGRNFETYGEDPCLSGEMGVAYVEGLQSTGVAASVKHFACNNQEFQRLRGNSVVDERTLREIYLPAFEAVVKRARPWTVMNAYNRLNGTYCCDHHYRTAPRGVGVRRRRRERLGIGPQPVSVGRGRVRSRDARARQVSRPLAARGGRQLADRAGGH